MKDTYKGKRAEDLSAEDQEKLAKGRKKFSATNDDADLDAAEILFRMSRKESNMGSTSKLVDVTEYRRISKAQSSLQNQVKEQHQETDDEASSAQHQETDDEALSAQHQETDDEASSALIYNQQPPFGYHIDGTKLPRLPPLARLQDIIERCSEPFVKQLTKTDLSCTHNRLSFIRGDVFCAILPLLNVLNYGNKDIQDGIKVTTYDHRGKEYQMVFKAWTNKRVYALSSVGWDQFVSENQLLAYRDWVTVWMFRRKDTGKLCFALDINRFTSTPNLIKKRYN